MSTLHGILFGIVLLCVAVFLTRGRPKEGFENVPVAGQQVYVADSAQKFNTLANTMQLPDSAIPLTAATSAAVTAATQQVDLNPTTAAYQIGSASTSFAVPDSLPAGLELAKKCQAAPRTCAAFDDATFAQNCGMSFDVAGVGYDGKPFTGGMMVTAADRTAQTEKAKTAQDPYQVYQPTMGKSKPGTFALTKDQCVVVKERVDCATKQTFSSPNCTQCYTSQGFSRVDPSTQRLGMVLNVIGNGTYSLESGRPDINSHGSFELNPDKPIKLIFPGDSEGAVFDLTVAAAKTPPTYLAGYIEGATARGTFKLDLMRLVQADKVSGTKPKLSGTKTVKGFRCSAMIPATGKTTLKLSCLVPFSFLNIYDNDALGCDNGPVLTKASSATFMESDPCFSKSSGPGNYKLECLQDRWTALGGTQKGTGYPTDQAKADALQRDGTKSLDLDTIVDRVAAKMRRAITGQSESGAPLSIAEWNEASMWGLGIPINTPCDGADAETGPLSKECLAYLYTNQGATSRIGATYTMTPTEMASLKGQAGGDRAAIPNTYCQPGTAMDPATPAGLAYGQSLGGIAAVKQAYDATHRLANDNSKTNAERTEAVQKCYGVGIKPVSSNKIVGPTQVFAVGPSYQYTKDQAAGVCAKYGAQVATTAQLGDAQKAGADWCFSAWVADGGGKWPITTSVIGGCGGRRGIIEWTPDSQRAGVTCYGPKPAVTDVGPGEILPFNQSTWDQPAKGDRMYTTVRGGYLQTSSTQPSCFSGLSPEQAQANCDQLGTNCGGFSYSVDGTGNGCYKGDVEGGMVPDANYMGYIKTPSNTGEPIRARYVRLQYSRGECMNLAQLSVYPSRDSTQNLLTPNSVVTKSSGYQGDMFPSRNLVDGRGQTFAHTSCYDIPWMMADLGGMVSVGKVVVKNRLDCCQNRAQGMVVILLDEGNREVYRSNPVASTNAYYTWFPPRPECIPG